jgi:hypothetical protein
MESPTRSATLLVGLLLVTVPLYAPLFDVTGTDYRYEASELTVEDNRLAFVDDPPRGLYHGVSGFDCYFATVERSCALEAATLDDPVTATHPTIIEASGAGFLDTDEPYLAYNDGRVFAYTAEWNQSERAFVLGVERTDASTALDRVARSARYAPAPILTAIRSGAARAADPLWDDESREARVVELDGDYYVVSQAPRSGLLSEKPLLERILEGISVVLGVSVLARVWSE